MCSVRQYLRSLVTTEHILPTVMGVLIFGVVCFILIGIVAN